jgi:hypothetical protein
MNIEYLKYNFDQFRIISLWYLDSLIREYKRSYKYVSFVDLIDMHALALFFHIVMRKSSVIDRVP